MKITHRVPAVKWWQVPPSAAVEPEYAAEVQRHTDASEREYRIRQERLARAEKRLARAQAERKPRKKQLATLVALVELRRAELDEYRKAMMSAPASAQHRGTKSYRPVPPVTGVPL